MKWVALKVRGGNPSEKGREANIWAVKPRGSADHSVPEGQCIAQCPRGAVQSAVPQKGSAENSAPEGKSRAVPQNCSA